MIYINHNKKAIFLHIPKTGGSYIGPTLVKYYGFTSYLSVIVNRRPDHNELCKTRLIQSKQTGNKLYDTSFFNKLVGLLIYCKTSDYLNTKMKMDETKWNSYTKFCFIRNPYDRVLSGWKHFNIILNKNSDLFTYINQNPFTTNISDIEYGHIFMSQKKQIEDSNGECGVDLIGRFEHLEEDFKTILKRIGFDKILHIETKKNVSNENPNNPIAFETKTIKRINELFVEDLELFHYKKITI